jgi:ABC-type dipeptide/oligopeptide/nickel transport system permease subunit
MVISRTWLLPLAEVMRSRMGSVIILLLLAMAGIFASYVAPYNPYQNNLAEVLQQPSWKHLLGTDILGRDVLTRVIYGSRTSLLIALVSATTAGAVGAFLGLIAGYGGGIAGMIIMRLADALMCFPVLVLSLLISVLLGGGIGSVMIALSIGSVAIYTRLMNGVVLSIKEKDYVAAARSTGSSSWRILTVHVLPNAIPSIIIQVGVHLGSVILAEASLSFLGIGVKPPTASWGAMIADGYAYLEINPVIAIAPGVALMLVAFAFNNLGDTLRDIHDPRLRHKWKRFGNDMPAST